MFFLLNLNPEKYRNPLFKHGVCSNLNSYCPISIIPVVGKVFERIVYNEFYEHLTENKLISCNQSRFRSLHSKPQITVCLFVCLQCLFVCNVYTGYPIQQRWFKRRPVYILALYTRQPQHRDHPTLFRIVRGFFYVPQNYQHSRNCETGPPTYRPYPRRLESLTICRWYYKGSTFSSVILRP